MNPNQLEVTAVKDWYQLLKAFPPIKKESMNKLIANYLIGAGFKDAADKFSREANVSPKVNDCAMDFRCRIIETIRNGNALEAMDLVESFAPGLLEDDHWMTFRLQQLQLIELIRAGSIEDALHYAQAVPWECAARTLEATHEMERTLALLAFPTPHASPFGVLLEQCHRDRVACTVNEAILRLAGQEQPTARMEQLFKLILWTEAELSKKQLQCIKLNSFAEATFKVE
uniref:CTLH domain-containing protein n=1 Tax=Anopheles christyi TaxID=43041 RepID=A0A182K8T0_9DIPT